MKFCFTSTKLVRSELNLDQRRPGRSDGSARSTIGSKGGPSCDRSGGYGSSGSHASRQAKRWVSVGACADDDWISRRFREANDVKATFVESVPEGPDVARIEQGVIDKGLETAFATTSAYRPFAQQVA